MPKSEKELVVYIYGKIWRVHKTLKKIFKMLIFLSTLFLLKTGSSGHSSSMMLMALYLYIDANYSSLTYLAGRGTLDTAQYLIKAPLLSRNKVDESHPLDLECAICSLLQQQQPIKALAAFYGKTGSVLQR